MSTYAVCRIYPYYREEYILAYFLISLLINHRSSSSKVKTNSLILSSSGCYKLKRPVEKNPDVYKLMVEENLSARRSNTFIVRQAL